jgi:hypothetical protein
MSQGAVIVRGFRMSHFRRFLRCPSLVKGRSYPPLVAEKQFIGFPNRCAADFYWMTRFLASMKWKIQTSTLAACL